MAYKIDTDEPILRLTLLGTLTNDDLVELAREVEAIERSLMVVPPRLTDLRPVTRIEITFEGVLALANRRLGLTFPNAFKSAIVATNTVHFGFARMFETLNDHPQISIAIFPDSEAALEWLAIPGLAPPATLWSPRMASL